MRSILGINAFHGDSSAALVVDGELVAAVEEERFARIKHWAGYPSQSIQYCLSVAGIQPSDITDVAVSFDPRANLKEKLFFTLQNRPGLGAILARLRRQTKAIGMRDALASALECDPTKIAARMHHVEHHLAHAACGFLVSPFDKAAILSIDGMGDFVSTMFGAGEGNQIRWSDKTYYPHSVGLLYEATTHYLGFKCYGDEYKVMGLAPYGKATFCDEFRRMIHKTSGGFELNLDYFTHHKKLVSETWDNCAPKTIPFYSGLFAKHLGPEYEPRSGSDERMENIAASLQKVTEETIFHLLEMLNKKYPSDNVCITGGVAMNSVANGKAYRESAFKNIFVPVGAADNGTAIGAAFHVWNGVYGQARKFELKHALWGPSFSNVECRKALEGRSVDFKEYDEEALIAKVTDAICDGKVVGWYQGRMEFAARALGNRSLVADPRRADMRDIINLRIKFREKFRPFAPSILEDRVGDYFEDAVPSPFMEKVVPIRKEKRSEIPAVTHVDGTGRLQTVDKETNPLYWKLIKSFEARTGVPILLNTSFNENEPIVSTPEEALACFQRTKMDVIVLGSCYAERSRGE